MATIYDVAALAGVSPATVSRVFNGVAVSPAKVQAVEEAARRLRFSPNRTARSLRRRESEVIALVIPDIENPYFTEVARGVEDVAQQAGYSLVLCNTDGDLDKEARYLQIARAEHMAGVIIAAGGDQSRLEDLHATGRPAVAVDRGAGRGLDAVVMADRAAGREATTALADAGYRRIAFIAGPARIQTARERAEGWRAVVGAWMPRPDQDSLLRSSSFQVEGGRAAMAELMALPEPPEAVVAGNNLIGVGAIQVLSERGTPPPQVAVAVIGSLPFTTLSPRAVTIVRLPSRRMGTQAAQMLLERIAGEAGPARTVELRGSVQPADHCA